MDAADLKGVYGSPVEGLKLAVDDGVQFSPLMPGSAALEEAVPGSLGGLVMVAPPGTIERRMALALGLRSLAVGAPFTIVAPKDKGGARLGAELGAFGCAAEESGRRHHRICVGTRPAALLGVDEAAAAGGPRRLGDLGLWSQPGIFSWDRLDPGTGVLIETLPALSGRGADFGCGLGLLARAALRAAKVKAIVLIDIDRRAVEAARRNVDDPRATFRWADLLAGSDELANLDFVVMNPPFHQGGVEDKAVGQGLVAVAARSLRRGGALWLVANRHLPYEAVLKPLFSRVETKTEARGFKVIEAHR